MRIHGEVMVTNGIASPELNIRSVKEWASKSSCKETIAAAGMILLTWVVTGYLSAVIYRGFQGYAIGVF